MENIEKFGKYFHSSWIKPLTPFINSEEFNKIQEGIKATNGRVLPRTGAEIFRCFKETPLDNLKVVMLGLSPYFTPNVADGLAFSCSKTGKEQPSLQVLLTALENDLGYKDDRNPDLLRWAKQGVLLLNASLTALPGDARCHLELWRPFIEFLFKEIFYKNQLITVFFGKDASYFNQFTNKQIHYPIGVNHPSYFARNNAPMQTNLFSDTNRILKNWEKSPINWLEYREELPWKEEKVNYKEFI